MDEEKKSLNIENADSELQDCPLSVEGWIVLLNSEINNEERIKNLEYITQITTFVGVLIFSSIAIMVAVRTTNLPANAINNVLFALQIFVYFLGIILFLSIVYSLYERFYVLPKIQKKVNSLKHIRKNVIDGVLLESNAIRKKWKEAIKEKGKDI